MRQTWMTLLGVGALAAAGVWWFLPRTAPRPLLEAEPVAAASGPGVLVVDLLDGSTDADLARISASLGATLAWTHPLSQDEALARGQVPDLAAAVALLSGDPSVEAVEPLLTYQIDPSEAVDVVSHNSPHAGYPNDPLFDKQWNLRAMGAEAGWASTPRGKGVIVAVIDTGVTAVEDLDAARVLEGQSFVPGEPTARDLQGHGTHVAGTIAQSTHNGKGVAGVAPDATILPIKVLSRFGSGQSDWIAAGIDHAADSGAQVINLSLGGPVRSAVIHTAVQKARKRGVIVVAAAGNSGRRGVGYPGALPETIGVSALGPDGDLAPYSSWGPGVDIAAPGGDTRKADGGVLQDTVGPQGQGHRYAAFQGTSMASPHVAGAAAVLLSTGMSPDAVERTLLESARGQGVNERMGHGALDLAAALSASPSGTSSAWLRFLIGGVLALLVGRLAAASPRWLLVAAGTAAFSAGGLFFLAWTPLSGHWAWAMLSTGVLQWPAALGLPWLVGFPLWLSAGLPVVVGLVAGAYRPTRALALGLAAGIGGHLFFAAATGELSPWWLGAGGGTVWLVVNATICVLVAMALAGTEKLDREQA